MKSYISRKLPAATRITCLIFALRSLWFNSDVILLFNHQDHKRTRLVHPALGAWRTRGRSRHTFHRWQEDASILGVIGHGLRAALRGDGVDYGELVSGVLVDHRNLAVASGSESQFLGRIEYRSIDVIADGECCDNL